MASTRTLVESLRVNVTTEQREALEALAQREERSVANIIRRAIREYLARDQKEEA